MRFAVFLATLAGLLVATPALAQQEGVTLQPDRLPGMCITMTGASLEAVSLPCSGAPDEQFDLPGPEGGPIRFSDKCLTPVGDGNYPPLVAIACDGSPEQTWTMTEARELRSAAGRCVSLLGAASRTGGMIFAAECPKDYPAHAWQVRKVDFTNVVEASLESLARPGQCIGYDTQLELYPCSDAYGQVMSFDEKALGQLRMMSSCLSGGFAFGALRLGDCWDMPEQKWLLLDDGRITNQQVRCIEVSNEEGRDVLRTKACTSALEQKWRVRRPPAVTPPNVAEPLAEPAPPEAPATPATAPAPEAADESTITTAAADPVVTLPVEAAVEPAATTAAVEPAAAPPVEPPAEAVVATAAAGPAGASVAVAPVEPAINPAAADPAITQVAAVSTTPAPELPAIHLATTLQHEQLPGMCMSLSGRDGETESRPCDGSAIQDFQLPGAEPGPIRNADRCLAPRGKGMYPQLVAEVCNASSSQTWMVTPLGELRNIAGRCLSLLGTSSRSGERIYAGECPTGLPAHRWRVVPVDPALARPTNGMLEAVSRPGKCLGTDGSLGLVACDARLGRIFSFDRGGPSQFRMMSSCIASGFTAETVALGQCWDMPAQKWSLTPDGNLANLDGKCITVINDAGRDVLRMTACLPSPEQQWTMKQVEQ